MYSVSASLSTSSTTITSKDWKTEKARLSKVRPEERKNGYFCRDHCTPLSDVDTWTVYYQKLEKSRKEKGRAVLYDAYCCRKGGFRQAFKGSCHCYEWLSKLAVRAPRSSCHCKIELVLSCSERNFNVLLYMSGLNMMVPILNNEQ